MTRVTTRTMLKAQHMRNSRGRSSTSAPTMADVARRVRTTPATVSRVINNVGYVSASLRSAVENAIRELGYVPNANARQLKTNTSRTIGVVVGDLLNPYAIELAS